ncbi:Aha1 domain protein [Minicystis rosea]|nr:Aha1 domain protein [Minicystis rosea]
MSEQRAKVIIERTYRARVADVWDLWTTKDGFESWWGPQGFRADVEVIEPRAGGALRYEMVADTPEMIRAMKEQGQPTSHPTHATFTEVRAHERLVITNVIDFLPGVAPYESNIAVDFFVTGDRVRMVVTLDAMHSEQFTKMQEEGFTSQLTKLDGRFA